MKGRYYAALRDLYSPARLDAYARRLGPSADPLDILAYYLWNTALSQALYDPLQALEVGLRNSLHRAAAQHYGQERWFDHPHGPVLEQWQRDEMAKAIKRLNSGDRRRLKTPTPPPPSTGRVIAELTLGFWVGFFDKRYDPSAHPLWRGTLLIETFPHLPPDEPIAVPNRRIYRTRHTLDVRLSRILRLRNRVMHHEPIWYWQDPPTIADLGEQHDDVIEVLGWLSPVLRATTELTNTFPAFYAEGVASQRTRLDAFLTSEACRELFP